MTTSPPSETGPSAEAEMEALIEKLAPIAREAVVASEEHTRIHHEKGGLSLEDAVANGREARADRAWVEAMGDEDDAALIDYLIRTRAEAKRSAHLEDAARICPACRGGDKPWSLAIYTDRPQPVRWTHKYTDRIDEHCYAGPVWDALSLLPGGRK